MTRLVLASASPRRKELLALTGLPFESCAADLDEQVHDGEAAEPYVERLAREKAMAVSVGREACVTLAADTSVVVDGEVLGKPGPSAEAGARMLLRLSGRSHVVMTGIAVCAGTVVRSRVIRTTVEFKALSPREVRWYVGTGEGHDKAGGYALQGRAGVFVRSLTGSSSNVIGLPLVESLELLGEAGVVLPWER